MPLRAALSAMTASTMAVFWAAVISRDMRLSEAIGRLGLVVVAIASHAIPGWLVSQDRFESHARGSGMEPDCAGSALVLAMVFSREDNLRR